MKIISGKKRIKIPRKVKRLKWGVAGCGNYLEKTFLPALQQSKRSRLASVYSSDIERSKFLSGKFAAEKYFNNYDEFLKSEFDALYIASINANHYEQVIKAAIAGKNILCEKPLAVNSMQAEEMVDRKSVV